MTWNLVTFAYGGKLYNIYQDYISRLVTTHGVNSFKYSVEDIQNTEVYKQNPDYFVEDNKYGWCSWKPLLLLETMNKLDEGDKIVLCDTEDVLHPQLFSYVDNVMGDDPCLLVMGDPNPQRKTVKRDCFVYMDCDEEAYWDSPQLEAGITFWRVCDEAKAILEEYLKWCLDERVNGEDSNFSGKGNFSEFGGYSAKDQAILTNIALRDGLSVDSGGIRNYVECNADYWYQRNQQSGYTLNRPVDQYMKSIEDECPYASNNSIKHSLILTVHNKEWLIDRVVKGICNNTVGDYELIFVFDGCSDNSQEVALKALKKGVDHKVLTAPDVFETKANNIGLREATGDLAIIIQDDMVIEEKGWNRRMQKPFLKFDDVFAVTARTAHNYVFNPNSQHVNMEEDLDTGWCDILRSCDEADKSNTPRDTFAIRSTVNRGPLMIDLDDLKKLNYLDEEYSPQDMDDHDLMYRAWKQLKKVCGCYWIDMRSDTEWGGTRAASGGTEPAPWLYKTQHKNSKIFYKRNKDVLDDRRIVVNRKVS